MHEPFRAEHDIGEIENDFVFEDEIHIFCPCHRFVRLLYFPTNKADAVG